METYRILSCLLPPCSSLRSPLTSLRSPHMLGFGCFAFLTLPSAAVRWTITLISPHMERTRGNMHPCAFRVWELSPHLPPGSEFRGSVRSWMRDIVYDDDHGFAFRLVRSGKCTVCCRPLCRLNEEVRHLFFDNHEEERKWPGHSLVPRGIHTPKKSTIVE